MRVELVRLFLCLFSVTVVAAQEYCAPVSGPKFCFTLFRVNKTFQEAESACRTNGQNLLSIFNKKHQNFTIEVLKNINVNDNLWFGLHSLFGRYTWTSDAHVSNIYSSSLPESNAGNCFSLKTSNSLYTWSAQRCSDRLWYICGASSKPVVSIAATSGKALFGCPIGYSLVEGTCFLVNVGDKLSRDDAANACRKQSNGSLATISTLTQQDFVSVNVARASSPVWIGLHLEAGEHLWDDRSNVTFTNWMPRQPLSGEQRQCTVVRDQRQYLGEWEDVDCQSKFGYVCQAPPTDSSRNNLGFLPQQGKCRSGFVEFDDRCYRVEPQLSSSNEVASKKFGETQCPFRLSPRSTADLALMRLLLRATPNLNEDHVWVGVNFTHRQSDAAKINLAAEDGSTVWISSLLDFAKLPISVIDSTSAVICVAFNRNRSDFVWMNCSTQLPSVCGYGLGTTISRDVLLENPCPDSWLRVDNRCYSPINNTAETWFGAESTCRSLHKDGHLVSLHDLMEHKNMTGAVRHERSWLGLRVQLFQNASRSLKFQWSDDSPVNFLLSKLERLSSEFEDGEVEQCFVQIGTTFGWEHVNCYDRHKFVCQVTLPEQASTVTPSTTQIASGSVDKTCYTSESGQKTCFTLISKPLVFWDAEKECQSLGMTLATIPDKGYQTFLMDSIPKLTKEKSVNAFIGLLSFGGRWRWVSHYDSLSSTFWSPNHPQQDNQCVFIDTSISGLNNWKSGPCDTNLPFICSDVIAPPKSSGPRYSAIDCPQNFMLIGSSCFSVHARQEDAVTWNEATQRCANSGAQLASISTFYEKDSLTALLGLQTLSAWIGLRLMDGVHSWVRSGPVVYTNWGPGQPVGSGTRCTFMNRHFNSLGEWSDEECDTRLGYICQADPIQKSTGAVIPKLDDLFSRGRCAEGYHEYRNQCFAVNDGTLSRSATDLHDPVTAQCMRMVDLVGARCEQSTPKWGTMPCPVVATPHTSADAAFLRVLLQRFSLNAKRAWVGVKIHKQNGTLTTVSEDGSLLGASSLISFEPSQLAATEEPGSSGSSFACVASSTLDTQLKVVPCDAFQLPVLCAYFLGDHPLHPQNRKISTDSCPPGWVSLNGKCFLVMPLETRLNWSAAEKKCATLVTTLPPPLETKFVGHLASVHSLEEQHHIFDLAPSSSLWLGLYSYHELPVMSALSDSSSHFNHSIHFKWSDGSPVDYMSLANNHFTYNQMECFTVEGDKSHWYPIECFQERNFICQLSSLTAPDDAAAEPPHIIQGDQPVQSNCDNTFPIAAKSGSGCFNILHTPMTWPEAEKKCRFLNPEAHLASFQDRGELDELIDLSSHDAANGSDVWIGLYESDLSYHWSDKSAVSFIPLSADLSKAVRHVSQDCFVLSNSGKFTVRAVDCLSKQPNSICKGPSKPSVTPQVDTSPQWNLKQCPPGYRQYADRCFSIIPQSLTWEEAEQQCSKQVKQYPGFTGSLARIDSVAVQEFVSSLLDNLPPKASSAWIGLHQNVSYDVTSSVWSDGSSVQFLRPIYRETFLAIFGQTFNLQMCTAVYRSTYPRLNGLWLQWSCEKSILLPAVCQAYSSSSPKEALKAVSANCPPGFVSGTTGYESLSGRHGTSRPVCYRFLNPEKKFDWKTSGEQCKTLSTPGFNVSLLALASVFEASFLRSWLRIPREMGGAGLSNNEPVWTGLKVTDKCPECLANWTWDTWDNSPVRFTDWLIPPSPSPSGCYLFHQSPYTLPESMASSGLGSLQPADSCSSPQFAVCQTPANEEASDGHSSQPLVSPISLQSPRPDCFPFAIDKTSISFLSNVTQTHTGKQCIRWDLIPHNLTDFPINSDWLKHRLQMSEQVGADGFESYAENYCSILYIPSSNNYRYECYVSANPPKIEECDLSPCPHVVRRYLLGPLTVAIIVLFFLFAVGVLAVGVWRGYAPLRAGYRRHFTPLRFTSKRMPRSSVQFVPPDTIACVENARNIHTTNGNIGTHTHEKDKLSHNSDHSRLLQTQSSNSNGGAAAGLSGYAYVPTKNELAQLGIANPIYTPRNFPIPEDDYDPEAEL